MRPCLALGHRARSARGYSEASSSMPDLWDEIAGGAAEESSLWADCLSAEPDSTAVFSPLGAPDDALGLETIYEGYLVHYGRSRLFEPPDDDAALLLGDYL